MKRTIPLDIMRSNADAMAERLKVLAHPERLLMLCRMSGDEVTVSELVELTGMSQSAVSQHLRILRQVGLVRTERMGSFARYTLNRNTLKKYGKRLHAVLEEIGLNG